MPLAMLALGSEGRVLEIRGGRGLVKRLSDLGFTYGTRVRVVHSHGSWSGPVAVDVKDSRIALGRGIAMKIMVEEVG